MTDFAVFPYFGGLGVSPHVYISEFCFQKNELQYTRIKNIYNSWGVLGENMLINRRMRRQG